MPNPPLHDTPSHPDRNDPVPHIVMGVQGRNSALQASTDDHIVLATQRALTYARHLFRHEIPAAESRNLTKTLAKLRIKYSRAESERLAIADANQFQFTPAQIRRDIQGLRRLGSLDALIVHHNDKQKDSGLNETRDLYIQQCSVATYSTYEPHSQRSRTHANTATLIQVKALPITPPLLDDIKSPALHKRAHAAPF